MWRMKERFWLTTARIASKLASKLKNFAMKASIRASDCVPVEERTRRFNKLIQSLDFDGPEHIP